MEDIPFICSYELTPQLVRKWSSPFQKRTALYRHWTQFILKIWLGMTALLATLAALCRATKNTEILLVFAALFVCLFLLSIFSPLYRSNRTIKQAVRLIGTPAYQQVIQFGDTIEARNGYASTTYPYERICFIDENEEFFFLCLDSLTGFVVYKDAFTPNEPDNFRDFIYARCGQAKPLLSQDEYRRLVFRRTLPRIIILIVAALCIYAGFLGLLL